jgi:adenylate cyclase
MSQQLNGELVPLGGGDTIPLIRPVMTLGRRESCDINLPYPNISGKHCEFTFREGYWYIRDLDSTNGVKVNGIRVPEKLLHPKDEITIGKRKYTIEYDLPTDKRALLEEVEEDILGTSLLERAGLERRRPPEKKRGGSSKDFDPGDFLLDEDEI